MDQQRLDDHAQTVGNFREHLRGLAAELIDDRAHGAAGLLLVLDQQVYQLHNRFMMGVAPAPAAPAFLAANPGKKTRDRPSGARAPKGQGAHRHRFNAAGRCECGQGRQRAPKGGAKPAEPPGAEARTVPLGFTGFGRGTPPPPADGADDPFDGGTFGSSSTTERGR